jgi:glycosyltransferase involved in cell wall biosynthesis
MNQSRLLVSIIVAMYNAERFISETLVSILREKETPIEVIVVNDKSTDRSLERVRDFHDERIRLIDGPGRGAPGAMNAGLAHARGSIIMICDSDDIFPSSRIRHQVQWLQSHPEYGGVCGNFSTTDSEGNLIAEMQCGDAPAEITNELINGKLRTSFCTYAIRSSLVQRIGGFREFFKSGYDLDFQFRLGEVARIAFLPENWYFWRLHESSITHTQPTLLREFFERTAFELQHQRRTSGSDDLQRGHLLSTPNFDQSAPHSAADHIQGQLIGRAWHEHRAGKKVEALKTGLQALALRPLNIAIWKSISALILKTD